MQIQKDEIVYSANLWLKIIQLFKAEKQTHFKLLIKKN